MPKLPIRLSSLFLTLLFLSLRLDATEVQGIITTDTHWVRQGSPYTIASLIEVAPGAHLSIDPGVEVRFAPDAGLKIDGWLIARGSPGDSIRFTSDGRQEPGAWGGIVITGGTSTQEWMEIENPELNTCALEYCIIEYSGSDPVRFNSALAVSSAPARIARCSIRNNLARSGAVYCSNVSSPVIEDCEIVNNQAAQGGGVFIGVGSKAVLKNNLLAFNHADETGGAVFLSLGEAEIIGNRFVGNSARGHGGAFYGAVSSNLVIQGNVFYGNKANLKSANLLLTGEVTARIENNVFEEGAHAIFLQGAKKDIQAADNWFGNPQNFSFHTSIRDRREDIHEPFVKNQPLLWAPPADLVTNPSKVNLIRLCRSDSFTDEIPYGVAEGAHLWIYMEAVDAQPAIRDVIQIKVASVKYPEGIALALRETGDNSGVFVGHGLVGQNSDQARYTIGDDIGGHITLAAPFDPAFNKEYATMSPKPLVEDFTAAGEISLLNLTNHRPLFTWGYWEILERPQTHFQVQVFNADTSGTPSGSPIWDTGESPSGAHQIDYAGPSLVDGRNYVARIRVNSGFFWSDPIDLRFRMNSLPTVPAPSLPKTDELVATLSPKLASAVAVDGEGDALTYVFEVFGLDLPSSSLLRVEKIAAVDNSVSWTVNQPLKENEGYRFRVRADDPYESGPWSEYRQFWINSQEEPAAAFGLSAPTGGSTIYPLHPELVWSATVDPDPLSSVKYTVEVSKSENFAEKKTYSDVFSTSFMVPDSLTNRQNYYWRVTAADNTGRKTSAASVGRFYVDTTPSVPVISAPLAGEERQPADQLTWAASSDPDPNDAVMYDLEVFTAADLKTRAAGITSWNQTAVRVDQLQSWESLTDNHVYFWQVRARDNHNADSKYSSAGSFFFNRYNDPPSAVAGITAPRDTVMGTRSIRFTWGAASDPDLSDPVSSLVYDLEAVLSPGKFDADAVRRFNSDPGSAEMSVELDDNRLWQYRLRSRDNEGAVSAWSAVKTALINFVEDAPAPFGLISPTAGSSVAELDSVLFQWDSSFDPDWESSIKYQFELYEGAKSVFSTTTPQTQAMCRKPLNNESSYRWIVTAVDNTGLKTAASSEFNFTTNSTPTAPAAAPMPAELMPQDPFQFTGATDPNPADKLTYTLETAADAGFATPLAKAAGLAHSSGIMKAVLSSLNEQDQLADDRDYFFRVRSEDNHGFKGGWSEPVKFRFNRANDAPTAAKAPFAPIDSLVVRAQSPCLSWEAATDEDLTDPPSSLVYDLQLFYLGQTDKPVHSYASAPGAVTFEELDPLRDNTMWLWRIRSRDNDGAVSDWSKLMAFLVNAQEDAPTTPVLTSPKAGQQFNILGPIDFSWSAAKDIDYQSSITYRLEYGTDPNLSGVRKIDGLKTLTAAAPYPLQNATYYWRVTAVDNTGLETASSIQSFVCETRPSTPRPTGPVAAAGLPYAELTANGSLAWAASTDPNPQDKITYTVEIGKNLSQSSESILRTVKDLTSSSLPASTIASSLKNDEVYNWRTRAVDNHGIESGWSEPLTFAFNPANDAPTTPPSLTSPAEGAEVPAVNLAWAEASDHDLNDVPIRLVYVVELSQDKNFSGSPKTLTTPAGQTSLTVPGLTDDSRWYWRVKTRDPLGAESPRSPVAGFIFNSANDAPGVSAGLTMPVDGATVAVASLSWQPAADKDLTDTPDKLSYRVDMSPKADFTGERKSFTSSMGQTTLSAAGITDDARWYWRVITIDDGGAESAPSAVRSFILNTANDAPEKVGSLLTPKGDEVVAKASLSWSAATDRDLSDLPATLSYEVELSTTANFSANVTGVNAAAGLATAAPTGLKDNSIYYWRVRAIDKAGAKGVWSETAKFTLNAGNDSPQGFDLLEPAEGASVSGSVTLKWSPAQDADPGEMVSYTVVLARDNSFAQQVTRHSANKANEFRLAEGAVNEPGAWYWKVLAEDGHGGQAWSNGYRSFTVAAPTGN